MMDLIDATARDSIALSDLLHRIGGRLDATAAMIAQVEASLGILVSDARGLTPDLIRDLQKIDLARQTICDIGRVLRLVAAEHCVTPVSAPAITSVIHLRDLADHLLRPFTERDLTADADRDTISWF